MHLLFDLDGTLTDPKIGFVTCIKYALERLAAPVPGDAVLASHIGPPLQRSFAEILGARYENRIDEAVALYRERYATTGLFENHVYPGIPDALRYLRRRAASMHVATSKPTVYAQRIIEHFGLAEFFDGVYGSELDGARADKSELLAYVLASEKLAAGAVMMIGDRSHDVIGALRNGIRPVGVLWGYGSQEELSAAGAHTICDTPGMLRSLL